jgi:predicted nucleotidyltransferase
MTTEDVLARVAQALRGHGAREVYVFGLFARGQSRTGSDIDVAVSGVPASRFFAAAGAALGVAGGRMVDVIDLDGATPFAEYLRESGELRRVG